MNKSIAAIHNVMDTALAQAAVAGLTKDDMCDGIIAKFKDQRDKGEMHPIAFEVLETLVEIVKVLNNPIIKGPVAVMIANDMVKEAIAFSASVEAYLNHTGR